MSTTFLTAMVYSGEQLTNYEPGAQSPVVSKVFLDWIEDAAGRLPHSSVFWAELANRYYYVWKANKGQEMDLGDKSFLPHWWDDVPDVGNLVLGRLNGTNATNGAVSIARRGAQRRLW